MLSPSSGPMRNLCGVAVEIVSVRSLGLDELVLTPDQAADLEFAGGTIQINIFTGLGRAFSNAVLPIYAVGDRAKRGGRSDIGVLGHAIIPRESLRLLEGPLGTGKRVRIVGIRRHLVPRHATSLTSVCNLVASVICAKRRAPSSGSILDGDRVHRIGHFVTVGSLLLQLVRATRKVGNLELASSRVLIHLGARGLVSHVRRAALRSQHGGDRAMLVTAGGNTTAAVCCGGGDGATPKEL